MITLSDKTNIPGYQLLSLLGNLYPSLDPATIWEVVEEKAVPYLEKIDQQRENFSGSFDKMNHNRLFYFDESTVFLITYPDMVTSVNELPLETLRWFIDRYLSGMFSHIHFLPFYPFTSDDGFSVVDYLAVDSSLGSWQHINNFAKNHRLMFDAVINHISTSSSWFMSYLQGDKRFHDFFIKAIDGSNYSAVTRPRTSPLFTAFQSTDGEIMVWTTFSDDQVDLNFRNWRVLVEVIDVLLRYVSEGASVIRLDAASYFWKQEGTNCSNLEQCHSLIKIIRAVLDIYAPWVVLITETNVEHNENIKYLGNGQNEAQLVYQFALPPLVAFSFINRNVDALVQWSKSLTYNEHTTYFNFLASHDGIGLVPVNAILSKSQVENMINKTKQSGGFVSYKSGSDNQSIPYELNCAYYELIAEPQLSDEDNIHRFITSQSILLALKGVPAIYYHSLLGTLNNKDEVESTGNKRRVNRKKFIRNDLKTMLEDKHNHSAKVLVDYAHLIHVRRQNRAFHPHSDQQILDLNPSVFCILRQADIENVLCLANTSLEEVEITLPSAPGDGWCIIARDSVGTYLGSNNATVAGSGFLWLLSRKEEVSQ